MLKQGPMLSPVGSPLGAKNLGVDMDEGGGSGFSKRKVVQGSRGFSSWGLPKLKPHHPEQVWRVAMGCGLQPKFLGSFPFPLLLWDWPCCHLHGDQVNTRDFLRGLRGQQSP